jgi:predicted transcriptional regulator
MTTKKGTWDDPAIVNDGRIDHENPTVRAVAEKLHANESMHMHEQIPAVICAYCALRTSRVLRWAAELAAGQAMTHDTPWGLVRTGRGEVADAG